MRRRIMPLMNVNDVDLNYKQTGEGEAVVFLHGYTGSTRDWANQIPVVSKKYMTIAIDHRGHGGSEAPTREEEYSVPIMAEDVHALVSALGVERCCLVGHSMGGFMALQLALDHPEFVRALVLVDTSSGEWEIAPGYAELRARLDELARNEGMEAAFEYDAANNPSRIERFKKHPELREVARQRVMNTSVDGYIYIARSFGTWQPVTSRLREISVPTLIFWGDEDAPFLKPSQILEREIGDAELVTVPGVGHSPHEEASDLFNESLLPFLSRIRW
jgi:2-succinyl-6-hydroxy-2,4-cyclohexadiene-1-carboxylate synthase